MTLAAAATGLTIDLGGTADADTLTLAAGTNSVTVSNVETITGGAGNDTITKSGGGNSTIIGGSGSDSISAGTGGDVINGGTGNDSIVAGAGTDTVQFTGAIGSATAGTVTRVQTLGADTITNWTGGTDLLRFSEAVFGDLNGAGGVANIDQTQLVLLANTGLALNTANAQIDGAGAISTTNGAFVFVGTNTVGSTVALYWVQRGADATATLADSLTIGESVKIADITLVGTALNTTPGASYAGIA